MLLICIRHLQTAWNRDDILQGRCDVGVLDPDENAQRAIHQNRTLLDKVGEFDIVAVSTLKRTRQTAELHGFTHSVREPLLDELAFGSYEGQPREKLLKELGTLWTDDPRDLVLGESLADLEIRIRSFLRKYSQYRRVLVFGHGSWLRGLLSITEHGDLQSMNKVFVENSHILFFEVDASGGVRRKAGVTPAGSRSRKDPGR